MSETSIIDIVSEVARIVDNIVTNIESDEHRFHELCRTLRTHPHVEAIDSINFRYNEYEIATGGAFDEARVLKSIRHLEIAIAPEVAEILPLGDRGGVLITRYWACPGERMVRAHETTQKFRPQACKRFRSELQILADHGKMHPYVRGLYHWLVSSETGTIVLDSWSAIRDCEPEAQAELMKKVDRFIESRTDIQ